MSWLQKLLPSRIRTEGMVKKTIPEGLWIKCDQCSAVLYGAELERNQQVCPKCGHHMRISIRKRLEHFLDAEPREELATTVEPVDMLKFRDQKKYRDRIAQAQRTTGEKDAFIAIKGRVLGEPLIASGFDFAFMGGSMGSVVGEKFVRAANRALDEKIPLVTFMASYSLSRKDMYGQGLITFFMVFTMWFGGGLIPFYLTVSNTLKLSNSLLAVILGWFFLPAISAELGLLGHEPARPRL